MLVLRVPPRVADASMALLRRLVLGDLTRPGLPAPAEGPFQRLARTGEAPAVVDRDVLTAIRAGRLEVVAGVTALAERAARLADGNRAAVDTVIAATGYRTGPAPLVGHLGVLDDRGRPLGATAGQIRRLDRSRAPWGPGPAQQDRLTVEATASSTCPRQDAGHRAREPGVTRPASPRPRHERRARIRQGRRRRRGGPSGR